MRKDKAVLSGLGSAQIFWRYDSHGNIEFVNFKKTRRNTRLYLFGKWLKVKLIK
jgi:hypothetical protein